MFGHRLKRGAVVLCLAAVFALPVCAEGRITTDMTMKEIRSDPAIAGSGISTYIKGDADSLALRRLYENKTLLDLLAEKLSVRGILPEEELETIVEEQKVEV